MTNLTILPPTASERRILAEGTFQARDAGMYPVANGKSVRQGVLYRADALSSLSDADLAEISALGVALVVDLREKIEADAAPDVLPAAVDYRRIPIFEETLFSHDFSAFPTLLGQYQLVLDNHAPKLVEAISAIAQHKGAPVIVHCTAGKDRTGLIIALIHLVLGVDEETVLLDYGASEIILGAKFNGAVRDLYQKAGLPRAILGADPRKAPPSYLAETLAEIRRRFGSVESFLIDNGMQQEDLDSLRANFLSISPGS